MTTPQRRRQELWGVVLLFGVLTMLFTWPQVVRPFSVPDHVDSYFSLWRLSWIAHQIRTDPRHLFDANIFFPAHTTLAYSDAMLFEGLLAAPFIWMGVPVVVAYNAEVLLTFVACGAGAWLLVRDLTESTAAGLVAGVIFAFVPYRFDHYMHLELLNMQWMPLTLWSLHRTVRFGRLRDGLITGCCGALLALSTIYYALLFSVAIVPVAVVLVAKAPQTSRLWAALGIAVAISTVTVALYARPYRTAHATVGERSAGDLALYSAGPKHYLASMPNNVLYGRWTADLGRHEKRLFPGLIAIALVVCALWPPVNMLRAAYALGLALAVDLSFGYRGLVASLLIEHVEVFRALRAFARSGAVVMLFVAVLAGQGLARIRRWSGAGLGTRMPVAAVILLTALLTLEYLGGPPTLVEVDPEPAAAYRWLVEQPRGAILELPLSHPTDSRLADERYYLYASAFHFYPMVNGYSGFRPDRFGLRAASRQFPADNVLAMLAEHHVRYVLVHSRFMSPDSFVQLRTQAATRPELTSLGTFPDAEFVVQVYEIGVAGTAAGQ